MTSSAQYINTHNPKKMNLEYSHKRARGPVASQWPAQSMKNRERNQIVNATRGNVAHPDWMWIPSSEGAMGAEGAGCSTFFSSLLSFSITPMMAPMRRRTAIRRSSDVQTSTPHKNESNYSSNCQSHHNIPRINWIFSILLCPGTLFFRCHLWVQPPCRKTQKILMDLIGFPPF